MTQRRRTRPWLRRLLAVVILTPLVGTLTGGTCHYHHCHHHDHDHDHCDHHHDHSSSATLQGEQESYRLIRFQFLAAIHPDAHPVDTIFAIEDVHLGHSGDHTTDQIAEFTRRVYDANRPLIGLPAGAGELVLDDVVVDDGTILVRWRQVMTSDKLADPRTDGFIDFVLDPGGNLLEIENNTWLR